jgi:hypothetical protein
MSVQKQRSGIQPSGTIRRSQIVTTFGPGAMVDLVHDAVLIGGLDFWSYDRSKQDPVIPEPRLRDALIERFRAVGRELSAEKCFREPPIGDDREPTRHAGIAAVEFPQWFVCQNPDCRALMRKDGLDLKDNRYWHRCASGKKAFECVPVRFIGACPRGHTQEWPWISFAHLNREEGKCGAPSLRLREGSTGDFSEVRVECACGAANKLSAALAGVQLKCDGRRPWLGTEGDVTCEDSLRLLVRTASNSYFAQVVSALSVPEPGKELDNAILEHRDVLFASSAETLPAFRQIPKIRDAIKDFDDDEVLEAIRRLTGGGAIERPPLRTAEFFQFTSSKREQPGELPAPGEIFFAREIAPRRNLPQGVAKVVLAPRLREVRAQIGFTRLEPSTADLQGEFDLDVKSAPLGLTTNWLPATEIWGEGVFIQLDERAVRAWEDRETVKRRADELRAGYDAWRTALEAAPPPFPGARFYMLHSLAHLLISAISLECGYSASAIRERIYCGPSARDPRTPMAAILLSTGSSGTEGTLGGLVDQGRCIRDHLRRAYDLGKLCSNDPVCADHSPQDDPSERFLEGAACHGCLFIAECSCERFNRYLDRALVVPSVGHEPELAFFSERP